MNKDYSGVDDLWEALSETRPRGFPTTYSKHVPLHTYPSWTDERFKEPQTVFGKPSPDQYGHKHLSYDYDDRLRQWDHKKSEQAHEEAKKSGHQGRSCFYYEAYLSAYYDKPIEIEHIMVGINHSNGYPYVIFGHKEKEAK